MFTQLAMELGFHSALLPPNKDLDSDYRTKKKRGNGGDTGPSVGLIGINMKRMAKCVDKKSANTRSDELDSERERGGQKGRCTQET